MVDKKKSGNVVKKKAAISRSTGATRKAQNIAIRKEQLREKMKGIEYLRQIENDYKELDKQQELVATAKVKIIDHIKVVGGKEIVIKGHDTKELEIAIVRAEAVGKLLKIKMDTNFRRLAKVLPDLKAVELTDGEGKNPLGGLADALRSAVIGLEKS